MLFSFSLHLYYYFIHSSLYNYTALIHHRFDTIINALSLNHRKKLQRIETSIAIGK